MASVCAILAEHLGRSDWLGLLCWLLLYNSVLVLCVKQHTFLFSAQALCTRNSERKLQLEKLKCLKGGKIRLEGLFPRCLCHSAWGGVAVGWTQQAIGNRQSAYGFFIGLHFSHRDGHYKRGLWTVSIMREPGGLGSHPVTFCSTLLVRAATK